MEAQWKWGVFPRNIRFSDVAHAAEKDSEISLLIHRLTSIFQA